MLGQRGERHALVRILAQRAQASSWSPADSAQPDSTFSVVWDTDRFARGALELGSSPTALGGLPLAARFSRSHYSGASHLVPGQRYFYRVAARDPQGRLTRSAVQQFVAPAFGVADSRLAQWPMGPASNVVFRNDGDGELRLAPGATSGTYVSRLHDAEQMVGWTGVVLDAGVPAGAGLGLAMRTGSTDPQDASWTPWIELPNPNARLPAAVRDSRYLQYRLQLTGRAGATPVVHAIGFTSTGKRPRRPGENRG